jgi:hypothetical protein
MAEIGKLKKPAFEFPYRRRLFRALGNDKKRLGTACFPRWDSKENPEEIPLRYLLLDKRHGFTVSVECNGVIKLSC